LESDGDVPLVGAVPAADRRVRYRNVPSAIRAPARRADPRGGSITAGPTDLMDTAIDAAEFGRPQTGLVRGGAIALVARAAGVAISVVTGIVTARFLGPEGKGVLSFLSA